MQQNKMERLYCLKLLAHLPSLELLCRGHFLNQSLIYQAPPCTQFIIDVFSVEVSELMRKTQAWLSSATSGIDSEDSKLVEHVRTTVCFCANHFGFQVVLLNLKLVHVYN